MPLIGIRNELLNGELKIIPAVGFPIKSHWHLIWLKNEKMNPVAKADIDFIKENKENILEEIFSWIEAVVSMKKNSKIFYKRWRNDKQPAQIIYRLER